MCITRNKIYNWFEASGCPQCGRVEVTMINSDKSKSPEAAGSNLAAAQTYYCQYELTIKLQERNICISTAFSLRQ